MADVRAITLTALETALDEGMVADFRRSLGGNLIIPGDADSEEQVRPDQFISVQHGGESDP